MKNTAFWLLAGWAAFTAACSGSESEGAAGSGGTITDAGTEAALEDSGPDGISEDAPESGLDADAASDAGEDANPAPGFFSVDGTFDEWTDNQRVASDPAGDALGPYDITDVWAAGLGPSLYIRARLGSEAMNLLNGPAGEQPLKLEVRLPDQRLLAVDLRAHTVMVDGAPLHWSDVGFQIAPTTATTEAEIKLDLAGLGVVQGDTVTLDFAGSDTLDAAATVVMDGDAQPPDVGDPSRAAGAAFRIASLNVWWDGLTAAGQAEPIGRLIRAVSADIYCLQEVFETEQDAIAQRLKQLDPHGDGANWNVYRTGDTAIATREALTPWPGLWNPPYTGGGITFGDGSRLVVFTLRPKCCGYIGDASDNQRIAEFEALATAIGTVRAGTTAGFEEFADAPIVVVGDWNLVGSYTPVDIMTDPAGPGLERWLLRHLVGDRAIYTWRDDELGSFPPGTLDVLAYGDGAGGSLEPLRGYVLDTADLESAMLDSLGLQAGDSAGSDHLMLVADFGM